MEASTLQPPAALPQTRVALGTPLLRFRSDDQLVALFRAGHEDAFRAIHERYHKRLFAYARQMLPGRQDAEDALQDVFVRAYAGLRASDHDLALRAWLFRVAHNRCIDELRRPGPPPPEVLQLVRTPVHDPAAEIDLRESLRRLIEDIRRLPEQQRSALLMRELAGMSYADLSDSLGVSIGAVKSLLVRARVALAQAAEARDTSCLIIRDQLVEAHDRGLRPCATARKHMRDCVGCKSFRRELRGMSRQLAAVAPAAGPLGVLAKALGLSGGAGGGGGIALMSGGGAASVGGTSVGVSHVATLLVAAVATAGGAVELQHAVIPPVHHPARAVAVAKHHHSAAAKAASPAPPTAIQAIAGDVEATVSTAPKLAATAVPPAASTIKPQVRRRMDSGAAFGGPVSGASGLSSSSSTDSTASTTSTAGTTAAGCSSPVVPGTTSTSTSSATTGGSTPPAPSSATSSTQAPAATVPASPTSPAPCLVATSPSTGTSLSSPGGTPSGAAESPTATSSSNGGSSAASPGASASASGGSSSSGTAPTGGSATAAA